jgi:hypothetical protein
MAKEIPVLSVCDKSALVREGLFLALIVSLVSLMIIENTVASGSASVMEGISMKLINIHYCQICSPC